MESGWHILTRRNVPSTLYFFCDVLRLFYIKKIPENVM